MSNKIRSQESERNLHPLLLKVERLMIQHRFNENKPAEILELLKQVFEEKKDPESCWRIAACYIKGYSVQSDSLQAQFYAEIAEQSGSAEGTFFLGRSYLSYLEGFEKGYPYFYQSMLNGISSGQFYEALCQYFGSVIQKNEKEALNKFIPLFNSGDSYWTLVYACNVSVGYFGFKRSLSFAKELFRTCRNQPLSHLTIFQPSSWDFSKTVF